MTSGTFRNLFGEPGCVVIPALYEALSARIVEHVRGLAAAVTPPVLADGDTGDGNPLCERAATSARGGRGRS